MGVRENECQILQNLLKKFFQNFTDEITILVKFDFHFLGLPREIFFGVTTDDLLHLCP